MSEASYKLLTAGGRHLLKERGLVEVKGKGALRNYWLQGPLVQSPPMTSLGAVKIEDWPPRPPGSSGPSPSGPAAGGPGAPPPLLSLGLAGGGGGANGGNGDGGGDGLANGGGANGGIGLMGMPVLGLGRVAPFPEPRPGRAEFFDGAGAAQLTPRPGADFDDLFLATIPEPGFAGEGEGGTGTNHKSAILGSDI